MCTDHLERGFDLAEGRIENLTDQVDLGRRDDVWRAQVDMVTAAAMVRARHPGQDEDAPLSCAADHPAGEADLLREGLPAGAIGHEFDAIEQPQPAHLPDD